MEVAVRALQIERSVPITWRWLKRAIDVVVGGCLLLLALPILVLAAALIVVTTGGTPVFLQDRVGMGGRIFKMYKLRTMVNGAHKMREQLCHLNEVDGPVFKIRNDPRVHGVGKFLRRLSIDELPNLVNVVLGDMSLVGPRPALPSEVASYEGRTLRRLSVPQGITCLWQIRGRNNLGFSEWMELDNQYVDEWSPMGDFVILLKTVPAVLRRDGAY